ncbi:hypothetical protein ABZ178_27295 [Streptomyces massasporeus]|nr:hypothetical protein [Streptomyces massasporeus]
MSARTMPPAETVVVLTDCSQEEIERAVRALGAADPDKAVGECSA